MKGNGVQASIFGGQFLRHQSGCGGPRRLAVRDVTRSVRECLRLITGNADLEGSVTGRHDVTGDLPGIFGESPGLSEANIAGTIGLDGSRTGSVELTSLAATGRFANGRAQLENYSVTANGVNVKGDGTLALLRGESDLGFDLDAPDARRCCAR